MVPQPKFRAQYGLIAALIAVSIAWGIVFGSFRACMTSSADKGGLTAFLLVLALPNMLMLIPMVGLPAFLVAAWRDFEARERLYRIVTACIAAVGLIWAYAFGPFHGAFGTTFIGIAAALLMRSSPWFRRYWFVFWLILPIIAGLITYAVFPWATKPCIQF